MPLAVCATPIGNLDDVTLRVLEELRFADLVLCEDTRHTRVLLDRHGIKARLLSYHEHNEAKRTAEILPRLAASRRGVRVSPATTGDAPFVGGRAAAAPRCGLPRVDEALRRGRARQRADSCSAVRRSAQG